MRTLDELVEQLYPRGERTLAHLTIELTYRCNFECRHCYCRLPAEGPTPRPELTLAQWQRLLAEAKEMGALFVLVTGGEPLLWEDFRPFWRGLREQGFIATLFTNGALIDEEMADFLAEYTPYEVSITLYGASEETYRVMTGRVGMFARVMRNIERLAERGLRLEIKSVITRHNVHEFAQLRELAWPFNYKPHFRWDAELTGCYPEGGGQPLAERIEPEEIIALELADERRRTEMEKYVERLGTNPPQRQGAFTCGAGRHSLAVDPYGQAHPCPPLAQLAVDVSGGGLAEAWQAMPALLASVPVVEGPCNTCSLVELCRLCPAQALAEGAQPGQAVEFACRLAHLRAEAYGIGKILARALGAPRRI